jgi:G:T-mismatch repair DNA endonuclease (very short patch repair protein)
VLSVSEETKAKISVSLIGHKGYWLGKKIPEEAIRKRTETRRGNDGYRSGRKGCHLTKEIKERLSQSLQSYYAIPENKACLRQIRRAYCIEHREEMADRGRYMAQNNMGKSPSLETRQKIAMANRGYRHSEEARYKMHVAHMGKTSPNKGKQFHLEHCKHLGDARRKYFENPENRQHFREHMLSLGLHMSEDTRRKLSASMKKLRQTVPAKGAAVKGSKRSEHCRDAIKKLWQNADYKKMALIRMAKACAMRRPNKQEMRLSYILRHICPYEYRYNGDARHGMIFGGRIPDFVNVNGKKKVIELFGDWWHGERRTGRTKEQEELRCIKHYADFGYSCLIVWQSEFANNSLLKTKIEGFVKCVDIHNNSYKK